MCYTNSADVLFAAVVVYQLRVVERIWGSRKMLVRLRFIRRLEGEAGREEDGHIGEAGSGRGRSVISLDRTVKHYKDKVTKLTRPFLHPVIHPRNTALHNHPPSTNPIHPQPPHPPLNPLLHHATKWTYSLDLCSTSTIPRRYTIRIPLSSFITARILIKHSFKHKHKHKHKHTHEYKHTTPRRRQRHQHRHNPLLQIPLLPPSIPTSILLSPRQSDPRNHRLANRVCLALGNAAYRWHRLAHQRQIVGCSRWHEKRWTRSRSGRAEEEDGE